MKISIINNLKDSGTFFLRGLQITNLYEDSNYTKTLDKFECTGKDGCVPLPNRTFKFHIPSGSTQYLYLKDGDKIDASAIWYSPDGVKSNPGGPTHQALAEVTITNVVSYDLSFVDAISCGVRMTYTPESGNPVEVMCKPDKPKKLTIDKSLGYPTILADKYTGTPESQKYAGCASDLADNICGQHKCRTFMAKLYEDPDSYCGWLEKNDCQGYCWAMDEWKCTDTNCGYGDHPGWPKDCDAFSNPRSYRKDANVYSCGKGTLKGKDGTTYWADNNYGCVDKKVKGQPTNPNIPRNGGTFEIEFIELPWMSGGGPGPSPTKTECGKACVSGLPCQNDCPCDNGVCQKNSNSTSKSKMYIFLGVGISLFLLAIFLIYWFVLRKK